MAGRWQEGGRKVAGKWQEGGMKEPERWPKKDRKLGEDGRKGGNRETGMR